MDLTWTPTLEQWFEMGVWLRQVKRLRETTELVTEVATSESIDILKAENA